MDVDVVPIFGQLGGSMKAYAIRGARHQNLGVAVRRAEMAANGYIPPKDSKKIHANSFLCYAPNPKAGPEG